MLRERDPFGISRAPRCDAESHPPSGVTKRVERPFLDGNCRGLEQYFEEFVEFVPGGVADGDFAFAVFVADFDFGA